jgi:hypothetical protein
VGDVCPAKPEPLIDRDGLRSIYLEGFRKWAAAWVNYSQLSETRGPFANSESPLFARFFVCGQLPNAIAPQDVASQIANMTVIRARLGGNMIQGFCRIGHSAAAELFVWGSLKFSAVFFSKIELRRKGII